MKEPARHIALYGNRSILRDRCHVCDRQAFILDGKFACCGAPASGDPARKVKRETQPEQRRRLLSAAEREEQLDRQENKCFYCFYTLGGYVQQRYTNGRICWKRLKVNWDHQVPYVLTQDNTAQNFVAACHVCNGIKAAFLFQTVEEARLYVQEKRKEKGYV